jgi:hypothetical protein
MEMENYCLAVVYSKEDIKAVESLINSYDPLAKPGRDGFCEGGKAVATIRSDYKHSRSEDCTKTNRMIVGLKNGAFNLLLKAADAGAFVGYDFRIVPYDIREANYPPQDCVYSLYLQVPLNIEANKKHIDTQIAEKMVKIVEMGWIGFNDFRIVYPYNQKNNSYIGSIVVTFHDSVPNIIRVMTKIVLDTTFWNDVIKDNSCQQHFCHVAWCLSKSFHKIRTKA